jgi:hypothetical protein
MKKHPEPIEILRPYDECVIDGALEAKELALPYVRGYETSQKNYVVTTKEYRLPPTDVCAEDVHKCKSRWIGFVTPGMAPRCLYECKHGRHSYYLVSKIRA